MSLTQRLTLAKKSGSAQPKTPLIGGKHLEQELDQLYISRKSSGNQRVVFNDSISKVPGLYNEHGSFNILIECPSEQGQGLFNLTGARRVANMEKQFELVSTVMKA
jgi:hypothetical protein